LSKGRSTFENKINMKTYTTCIFVLIIQFSFTQVERKNTEFPKIQTIPTRILTKAKGFALNESGQWVSAQNKIPYPKPTQEEIDNFVSYDLRDIKINDTLYCLFMKKYNTGWFTYPALMEGWNNTVEAEWFVLKKAEIDSVKIFNDSINYIKLTPIHQGFVETAYYHKKWNNATYIAEIQNSIAKQLIDKEEVYGDLIFHIAPYKSSNIVRFNFYSLFLSSPSMISNEYKPKDPKGKYSSNELKIFGTNILFDYCYYETDLLSFEKLFVIH
jgi:hypothetical protein